MGFIKTSDATIAGCIDDGKLQVCEKCQKPMNVIAFDESNDAKIMCKCGSLVEEIEDDLN